MEKIKKRNKIIIKFISHKEYSKEQKHYMREIDLIKKYECINIPFFILKEIHNALGF